MRRGWRIGVVAIWLLTRRGGKADRAEGTEMAGGREEEITLEGQHAPLLPSGSQRRPACIRLCVCHWLTTVLIESNKEPCVLTALMPRVWTGPGVREWPSVKEKYGRKEYVHFCLGSVCFMCVYVRGAQRGCQPASLGPRWAWGAPAPAGPSRCSAALSHPLALPLLLPSRPAQSTATCYQINISPHWRQHVIPPLWGHATHC